MNGMTMKHTIGKTLALVLVAGLVLAWPLLRGPGPARGETFGTVRIQGATCDWRAYRLVAGEPVDGRMTECSTTGLMNGAFWKEVGVGDGGQQAAEKLADIAAKDSTGAATARLGRAAVSTNSPAVEVKGKDAANGFSLPAGYWLLVSESSQPLLLPVGGAAVEATAKSSGPTLKKQVRDASGRWREAGEAGRGERVSYRIVASPPSNAAAYAKLPFHIVDNLPPGMWVDAEGVRVAVRDASGNERDVSSSCAVSCEKGTLSVDVGKGDALPLLPAEAGKAKVVVRYGAKLTAKSAVGAKRGNPNFAHVECPGSPTSGRMQSSERVRAQLFTWKLRLVKTGSKEPLEGAVFELRRADGRIVGKASTGKEGTADFPSMPSGTYQLVETEAPQGFKRAADTTVTVRADLGSRGVKTRISAHAEGAGSLKSVSVPKGTVTVSVDDEPGSEAGEEGRDSDSEGIDEDSSGTSPKTGDVVTWTVAAALALALAAAVLAACRFARRKGVREEPTGKEEGR